MPTMMEYEQQLKHLKVKVEDIPDILEERTSIKKYAWVIHDKDMNADGTPKEPHIHIMMHFGQTNWQFKDVAKWFNDEPQQCCKCKCGKWNRVILYLIHGGANDIAAGKYQYNVDEIHSNYAFEKDIETAQQNETVLAGFNTDLDDVIMKIWDGTYREYNIQNLVSPKLLSKKKSTIDNAFRLRKDRVMLNVNRNINVIFICGTPGSGKTTLAKEYAKMIGDGSMYISSSKNDSLQDYKGQEVLILDDLRDSAFEFDDILKMLDNHTASTVRSRFYNKAFQGSTIIITSTVNVFQWYAGTNEDRRQLYRRIGAYVVMDEKTISTYQMKRNAEGNYYTEWKYTIDNYVNDMFPDEEEEEDNFFDNMILMAGNASKVLSSMKASDSFKDEINELARKVEEQQKMKKGEMQND